MIWSKKHSTVHMHLEWHSLKLLEGNMPLRFFLYTQKENQNIFFQRILRSFSYRFQHKIAKFHLRWIFHVHFLWLSSKSIKEHNDNKIDNTNTELWPFGNLTLAIIKTLILLWATYSYHVLMSYWFLLYIPSLKEQKVDFALFSLIPFSAVELLKNKTRS